MTKRVRLFEALRRQQVSEPKIVLAFIKKSMAPVRYHADLTKFAQRRSDLNRALLFCGIELLEDGNLRQVRAASTVSEAHAVLEATKSRAKKIREKTGLTSDGHQLVDQAFSLGPRPASPRPASPRPASPRPARRALERSDSRWGTSVAARQPLPVGFLAGGSLVLLVGVLLLLRRPSPPASFAKRGDARGTSPTARKCCAGL